MSFADGTNSPEGGAGLRPEACRIYREAVTGLGPGWRLCGTLGIQY
jgi:hypothetical protein